MGFGEFYKSLRKDKDLIRFFERAGEEASSTYYTCHGENAQLVASKFYKTQAVVKYLGNARLASVSLSYKMLATAMRAFLLVESMDVEIWTGHGATWSVGKKASPGNVRQVEEFISTDGDTDVANTTIMAVHLHQNTVQRKLGVACINTTFCTISVFEFEDDLDFKLLEALVLQIGASECVVKDTIFSPATACSKSCPASIVNSGEEHQGGSNAGGGLSENVKKLRTLLRRCSVKCTPQPADAFSTKNVEDDLGRLCGSMEQHHGWYDIVLEHTPACSFVF
jgi:DNA mismatch repair protein MSH2